MTGKETEQLVHFAVRYAFEHDTGDIDCEFCQPEIAAGHCRSKAGHVAVEVCTQCLVQLFQQKMDEEGRQHG